MSESCGLCHGRQWIDVPVQLPEPARFVADASAPTSEQTFMVAHDGVPCPACQPDLHLPRKERSDG